MPKDESGFPLEEAIWLFRADKENQGVTDAVKGTSRFITPPALIHMLAHIKPFFGRGKHISFAGNPHI